MTPNTSRRTTSQTSGSVDPSTKLASLETRLSDAFTPNGHFLDTATIGLPPKIAIEKMDEVLKGWQEGTLYTPDFDVSVRNSLTHFSELVGVEAVNCAIVPQVSITTAMVAGSLPEGSTVLLAEEDFTSVLFPFFVQGDIGRLKLRVVPLERLYESMTQEVDLVAVSAVQSADGRVVDLEILSSLCEEHSIKSYLDLTQAAGWKQIPGYRFDVLAASAYKWLCSPRGTGFMAVSPSAQGWLKPFNAGWYAGTDPWTSIYGSPLRLSEQAWRYNVSPDWFGYYAAAPTLALLSEIGTEAIEAHNVHLANLLRSELGIASSNSAIVSLKTDTPLEEFMAANIQTSVRAGKTRITFHLYNDASDVEVAAKVLARGVR
jgi:selenocysteine lyase/cysteine desulfurase